MTTPAIAIRNEIRNLIHEQIELFGLMLAVQAVLEGRRFISASLAGHFLLASTLTTTLTAQLSWILTLISGIH
jgi:DNA-binding NarL/FixJ family response regulator